MKEPTRSVIPSSSPVILSEPKNLRSWVSVNSARNLALMQAHTSTQRYL